MDKIINKIAALGIPGLVLLVAMGATGYAGAAAITAALAALGGPLGMLGGIGMLVFLGHISSGITEYGFEEIYYRVLKKVMEQEQLTFEEVLEKIDSYHLSKNMKNKLKGKMLSMRELASD